VIFYTDVITGSLKRAIDETNRRRKIQEDYNKKMGITPETIKSSIKDIVGSIYESDYYTVEAVAEEKAEYSLDDKTLKRFEMEMKEAAKNLEFERAAVIRDRIRELKKKMLEVGIRS
jgi:excinuclease ABC subunit B